MSRSVAAVETVAADATLSVREFLARDRDRWNEYVRAHADGTFFHLAEWQEILATAFRHRTHYLYAERAGTIQAVLPLAEVKSLVFGHSLVSTPFCVYGGILANDMEAQQALESAACGLGRQLGVDYVEMRNRQSHHPEWPSKDLYVTFRRTITADAEANLRAIPRKQRAMVRKGLQKNLRAETRQRRRSLVRDILGKPEEPRYARVLASLP